MDNDNKENDDKDHKTITVTMNNKPVAFSEKEVTGLQIKEAAIAQGLNIQLDFKLFILKDNKDPKRVGDDEQVELKQDEKFRAVTPDDKS